MIPSASYAQLRHGIELFNNHEFFECHEVLEEIWNHERGARRLFLQSLIHFAVAFYHYQQGNALGVERQLRKGLKKLAGYLPEFDCVDTVRLYREGITFLENIMSGMMPEQFPEITPAVLPAISPQPVRR